jgi:hypothetical protein
MDSLKKLAFFQGIKSDVPNQDLAKELANKKDRIGIKEIADNLNNENARIQSDCIKVLYEIGYLAPELISDYADDFLSLLASKNNRLVWGGMIALSTVVGIEYEKIYDRLDLIKNAMEKGSVITNDAGIKALSIIASKNDEYRQTILPYLLEQLTDCRAKDVPQYSEKIVIAINKANKQKFINILESRLPEMTPSQASRIKKVIKTVSGL